MGVKINLKKIGIIILLLFSVSSIISISTTIYIGNDFEDFGEDDEEEDEEEDDLDDSGIIQENNPKIDSKNFYLPFKEDTDHIKLFLPLPSKPLIK